MSDSNSTKPELDAALLGKMRQLEERFFLSLEGKFCAMEATLEEAEKQIKIAADPRESLLKLHRLLHTLAGSAGTFGFPSLGEQAHCEELFIKEILASDPITESGLAQVDSRVRGMLASARIRPNAENGVLTERLENSASNATSNDASNASSNAATKNVSTKPSPPTDVELPQNVSSAPISVNLVYVVGASEAQSKEIATQINLFGYEVCHLSTLFTLDDALEQRTPVAVIIDADFVAETQELSRLKQQRNIKFPSIFMSSDGSFEARLAAARAGANSYFTKPIDMVALTDRLDALTVRENKQPYRILLMDDDVYCAEYYSALLNNVGMEVRVLNKPEKILQEMVEFRPELVLMDMYMPSCSGIELAQLLRQDNLYLDIPIVFLSTESSFGKQLSAIESGGDDFLTKPIAANHLLSSIISRIERYRQLRDLNMRDSLTGLYKHSSIKEHLDREIQRAKRSQTNLSLAMIDLDHFKKVNDNFGHPVGDHVIRTLSRLLQQRLRRTDIIGRYGGEEFAVIMPETEVDVAVAVLDGVRQVFMRICHHAKKGDFSTSFSAGVVELRGDSDGKQMFALADEALYHAKGNGRNQVQKAHLA